MTIGKALGYELTAATVAVDRALRLIGLSHGILHQFKEEVLVSPAPCPTAACAAAGGWVEGAIVYSSIKMGKARSPNWRA